jgi:hypothetical protein
MVEPSGSGLARLPDGRCAKDRADAPVASRVHLDRRPEVSVIPKYADDGQQVSFRVFEGDTCLQMFAPDLVSLRAAVASVRPGLTVQLEQEIAHPTAPQLKEAPTK